jgi:SAM-dependent methyltransferase
MMYDSTFYDMIRPGVQASAAVLVPLIMDHIDPRRVIDVGCGEGWWAHEFATHGCEVIGVDGGYVTGSPLGDRFLPHNLATPLPDHLAGRFDLAVCLEVAEHLPAARADGLVADLCRLAPVVLFSAAIPGQGGVGHVNEQWPRYWVDRFADCRYWASGALRWLIWDDGRVENWYKANTLVFARDPGQYPALFDTPLAPPWPVVHPVLYDARR